MDHWKTRLTIHVCFCVAFQEILRRELQPMFHDEVLPLLLSSFRHSPVEELTCSIFTVSESKLEQVLQELGGGAVTWGTRIDEDRIVLTIKGDTEESRLKSVSENLSSFL